MKSLVQLIVIVCFSCCLFGCASVDITKTGKGYFSPTNPSDIEILMTVPTRPYVELGTLTIQRFPMRDEAKMHNAVRDKAAPLGANAVIIQNQGMMAGNGTRWATGVAVRYK